MAAGPSQATGRFPAADGLRAVAALAVLAHHAGSLTTFSSASPLGGVTAYLDAGVAVFFVLSAFLLYRPWVAARLAGTAPPPLGRYLGRRARRIVPAYWAALAVLAALAWIDVAEDEWWRYPLFLQTYDQHTALTGIVVAWSLCVEVAYYLALPGWALLAGRVLGGRARRTQVRAELAALALLAVASLGLRGERFAATGGDAVVLLSLPAFADWFALGMALAVLSAAGRRPGPGLALGAALAAPAVLAAGALALDLPRVFAAPESTAAYVGGHAVYGLAAVLLLVPATDPDARSSAGRALAHPWARAVGLVSYGLFLWHFPLLEQLVATGLPEAVPAASFPAVLLAGLASGLAVATASWFVIERPVLAARPERSRAAGCGPGRRKPRR